jgi:CpeT protein
MSFLQKSTLFLAVLFAFAACSTSKKMVSNDPDLDQLVHTMVGHYNSTAQAERDTDYYNITLHMAQIWPADKANRWLYVEQAVTKNLAKPYRQRVYKVEKIDAENYKSIVYTLPDDKKVIGWWATPKNFKAIKPSDLSIRTGCTVFLKKQKDGSFSGSTDGPSCESSLRGAKYATSKVTISADQIESWDQGFGADGKQVWGAEKGGYQFLRQR